MKRVLYVPDLCCHLFSIRQAQVQGITFTFPGHKKYMIGKNPRGQTVLTARIKGSLFEMEVTPKRSPKENTPALLTDVILHQRLAHVAYSRLPEIQKYFKNIRLEKTMNNATNHSPCWGCSQTKMRRRNKKQHRNHKANEPLEVTHTDLLTLQEGIFGKKYVITFIDEYSRRAKTYCIKKKSEALSKFKAYKTLVENERKTQIVKLSLHSDTRDQLLRIQSDQGGEYRNTEFRDYLEKEGIQHYVTNADEARQNGLAERYGQTLKQAGLSMLAHAKIPNKYWPYAITTACHIINCLPTDVLEGKSPHEVWFKEIPDISSFRIFGSDAWVRVPSTRRQTGDSKSKLCTFLGYTTGLKGYVFLDKETNRIVTSGDAIFYEGNWITHGIKRLPNPSNPEDPKWSYSKIGRNVNESTHTGRSEISLMQETNPDEEDEDTGELPTSLNPATKAPGDISRQSDNQVRSNSNTANDQEAPDSPRQEDTQEMPIENTLIDEEAPLFHLDPQSPDEDNDIMNEAPGDEDTNTAFHHNSPGEMDMDNHSDNDTQQEEQEHLEMNILQEENPSPIQITSMTDQDQSEMITESSAINLFENRSRTRGLKRKYYNDWSPDTIKRVREITDGLVASVMYEVTTKMSSPEDNLSLQFIPPPHIPVEQCSCVFSADVIPDIKIRDFKIPRTTTEALKSPYRNFWQAAMNLELESWKKNDVYDDTVTIPTGSNIVGSKWVYALKPNSDGKIALFKARLVALGYSQKQDVDFHDTFAPVLQPPLLRSNLAVACNEDWEVEQIDIATAFLYGYLEEIVYFRFPDGRMALLLKAVYGLKQGSRQFNSRFNKSLERYDLERISGDACCYFKLDSTGKPLTVQVHVDDCVVMGPNKLEIKAFKKFLSEEYTVKDLGPINLCIGWEIKRNRTERKLSICQTQYIQDTVAKFSSYGDLSPVSTPAQTNLIYSTNMCPKIGEQKLSEPYLALLGSLLYIALGTRPDIAYAVSVMSRYSSNPGILHWKGALRILAYLNGTSDYGLLYGTGNNKIYGLVDASWARCPDTRKSRYGALVMLNNAAVDWRSKLQLIIALSSMESEYIGASELVRLITWLRQCFEELNIPQGAATNIGIDNKSAMIFAKEWITNNRSKHIDIRYHHIRQKIAAGIIELFYCPTKQMPADALTKPLDPHLFIRFRKMMGVHQLTLING